jgi:hypothetical protein
MGGKHSHLNRKDRLSTSPYCLPKLQEMVVPVATANIMGPHAVTNAKTKIFPWHSHTLCLNIRHPWVILIK